MRKHTKRIALCGLLAAVALVIMLLGGLIPVSTYVCPMLVCLLCCFVFRLCGRKMAIIWYFAVSFLVLILGPDKEAAFVFLLLGYYPVVKPTLDRSRFRLLWKVLLFNTAVLILTLLTLFIMGLDFDSEIHDASLWLTLLLLVLGNTVFFLLDRLLTVIEHKFLTGRKDG